MSIKTEEILIKTIRSVTVDKDDGICTECLSALSEDELKELFLLAKKHQVGHLVAYAMMTLGDERFSKPFYATAGLIAKQQFALGEISSEFVERKIPFIMLKGAVIRRLYPEAWMRNSCDIDVFVRESSLERAESVLLELGYLKTVGSEGLSAHDIQFERQGVHVELHYALIAEHRFPGINEVLKSVWDYSTVGETSEHFMVDEFFYFYHIAHMLKHFENGGFGIRPVLDLWFLNNRCEYNRDKRDELLCRGGLLKFEREMRRLSEFWFAEGDGGGLETLSRYLFSGGAYGTTANSVVLKKSKQGGRISYFLHRIFAPYSLLRRYYPILNKYPILLPVFEVKRWFDALRRDKSKYMRELRYGARRDENEKEIELMLVSLGFYDDKD